MVWSILLSREGVDLPTINEIDLVFFDLIWDYVSNKDELFFSYLKAKHLTHYIGVDQQKLGRSVYEKYFNSPDQVENYYEEGKQFIEEFKGAESNFRDKPLIETFKIFKKQFKKVCGIYSIISWFAIEAWQSDFEEKIRKMIKRNNLNDEQEKSLSILYKPWKKTALLEIQEKLNQGIKAKNIVENYQFLRSWVLIWYKSIDLEWVNGFVSSKNQEKEKVINTNDLIKLLNPNEEEMKWLELLPYIIFFKDWRDDLRRRFVYEWNFLFIKITEKYNIEYEDLGYLSLDEIECLIDDNNSFSSNDALLNILERKSKGCIIIDDGGKLKIKVINGVPEKYQKIITKLDENVTSVDVKGLTAQKGIVKGKVCIMNTYHDIKRVEEGDILIANNTHPNYLPAMKKAAAIVTNEGGLVSHAAIVARELNKPCIVGTKNATKVFKDGDIVEVDADKGIVRILLG